MMEDFDWIVKASKRSDKTIKKINNCLKNQTLEELMFDTEKRINRKYQNLYGVIRGYELFHGRMTMSGLKSLEESKRKWNLMVTMYNMEWEEKPWYEKIFKKKREYKKYR